MLAGSTFVIAGYGWRGRAIAIYARDMGARVIVCEMNAIRALEAVMDGMQVLPMEQAAPHGDIFVTATGTAEVLRTEHFERMKSGAVLANAGDLDVEIDVEGLRHLAESEEEIREHLTEFSLSGGRLVYLLAQGQPMGQTAAEGSPAALLDLSFSNQALCARYLLDVVVERRLIPAVYDVPSEINERVAELKLQALDVHLDTLNEKQRVHQGSWALGIRKLADLG